MSVSMLENYKETSGKGGEVGNGMGGNNWKKWKDGKNMRKKLNVKEKKMMYRWEGGEKAR